MIDSVIEMSQDSINNDSTASFILHLEINIDLMHVMKTKSQSLIM